MKKRQLGMIGVVGIAILCVGIFFVFNRQAVAPSVSSNNGIVIAVSDQKVKKDMVIQHVELSKPGFVVVHKDIFGGPGDIVGVSEYLEPGVYENVTIYLQDEVVSGMKLYALMHEDMGDKVFVVSTDFPMLDEQGEIFVVPFSAK